jgi:MoaA/NifB/PqqE/SkfB family radical SAM enzyme
MIFSLAKRVLKTVKPTALWKFCWNFGFKGLIASERFKRRIKRGEYFPAYLHISITNQCNLRCKGCWVDVDKEVEMISPELLNRVIEDSKRHGNHFFGILGGEPLFYPYLFEILERHKDCYFQIFTNGHLVTEKVAGRLAELGNATLLFSIEGDEEESDRRRGGVGVYNKSLAGLKRSIQAGLLTGVATSLCRTNFDDLLTEEWLDYLIELGVHYVWYYAYRPVGAMMCPELALSAAQQLKARKFIVEMRSKKPILIIDAYYDHKGRSLCPSATGISHHINWRGEIEPCPVIQFARENIKDNESIYELITNSDFLKDYRKTASSALRGCIVLERPDLLKELVLRHKARDTTARQTVLSELDKMIPNFSQWMPGYEIPEKHWLYYIAKKFWFNDFGAYKTVNHDIQGKRAAIERALSNHDNKDEAKKPGEQKIEILGR